MRFLSDDMKIFKREKENPYHDERGRFSSAEEDVGGTYSDYSSLLTATAEYDKIVSPELLDAVEQYWDEPGGYGAYDVINSELRTTLQQPSSTTLRQAKKIDAYIDGAPKFEGVTYRGISFEENTDKLESFARVKLNVGKIWTDRGYMSSTLKKDSAESFALRIDPDEKYTHPAVILKIKGKSGVSIGGNSEEEILYKRNTRFTITDVKKVSDVGVYEVSIEEISDKKNKKSLKENPYHDEYGRFTSAENDSGGVTSAMTLNEFGRGVSDTLYQSGIIADAIGIDRAIPPRILGEYNKQIKNLTNEYKILDSGARPIVRFMGSEDGTFEGVVARGTKGEPILVDFGRSQDAPERMWERDREDEVGWSSPVDEEKQTLSTVTHEMGHLISGNDEYNRLIGYRDSRKDFWKEANELRKSYIEELKRTPPEKIREVSLGQYANTNADEFMAEGFTEYKLNSKPGPYAMRIGKLYDKYFSKKKKSFSYSQSGFEIEELFNDN